MSTIVAKRALEGIRAMNMPSVGESVASDPQKCTVPSRRIHTYVLQVVSGQEKRIRELLQSMIPSDLLAEVFVPEIERRIKRGGEWTTVKLPLIFGYLFVRTPNVVVLNQSLKHIPEFKRLLGTDGTFTPLSEEETNWLEMLTSPGARVVGMSEGVIVGSSVRIVGGPLQGLEGSIVRIDRHKRLAFLSLEFMGRNKTIKVGLEVVSKSG